MFECKRCSLKTTNAVTFAAHEHEPPKPKVCPVCNLTKPCECDDE